MLIVLDKFCLPERNLIRKLTQGNYLLTCNILLLLFWLVSLLPFLTTTSKNYNNAMDINPVEFSIALLKPEYQKWLLVSIFVSVIIVVVNQVNFSNLF